MTVCWVDASSPWVDARLSDGSRVHAKPLTCSFKGRYHTIPTGTPYVSAHRMPTKKAQHPWRIEQG
jgi:hypothetical protein